MAPDMCDDFYAAMHNNLVGTLSHDVASLAEVSWRIMSLPVRRVAMRRPAPAKPPAASPATVPTAPLDPALPDPIAAPVTPESIAATDALIIDILRHRVGKDERAAKPHDQVQHPE